MTDPINGAAASSAQKIAENAGGSGVSGASDSKGASFDDVLDQVQQGAEAEATDKAATMDGVDGVDGVDAVDQVDAADGPAKARLDDFVNRINADQAEIEAMLERGMSGGEMTQKDLLQVQALIYGHAQRVELTSKVVSNATKGIKQVMNTQV